MTNASTFKANTFARDFAHMLALSDANNAMLAARRAAAQNNAELCSVLLADAKRRGESEINWPEYFRNARLT